MAATLEQFNEEVMKEFKEKFYGGQMEHAHYISYFITQKLAAHKKLILRMVREKVPLVDFPGIDLEMNFKNGREGFRKEFLNNLDTI